jgi:hypothetical protein
MAKSVNVVRVPKPSGKGYNPNRPLDSNALIKAQVNHFAEAERHLPPELRTEIDPGKIRTEGEASAYIRRVTEAIHRTGGRPRKVQVP